MDTDTERELPNKHIKMLPPSTRRASNPTNELSAARSSPAYWWYMTLRESDEYLHCCKNDGQGKLEGLYFDFGDVRLEFAKWWMTRGRKIFAEQKPLKRVQKIGRKELDSLSVHKDQLIIQIPLTVRKQTVMRQIGKILKEAYEGRDVDIWKQSTATRQIVKSRVRMTTVEILLTVMRCRNEFPALSNYAIGVKANIELDIFARDTTGEILDLDIEKRRMTIAVSRYLGQARNLIANAERGIFPSLAPITD